MRLLTFALFRFISRRATSALLFLWFMLGAPFPNNAGTCGHAQIGLHPPRIDWQRLKSPQANILYPAGYEARAHRVATLLERLQTNHTVSIGERYYRYDLVLQTHNPTINGYVGLAPFRSEYYLTPPQNFNLLSTTPWADLLTIHEHRHVMQAANERVGITRFFSWLFGQQAWLGMSNLATPNWFSEGDAVIFETALSPAGRGRTPAFSADLRALLAAGRIYRYGQARNGSFRRLIPDHYVYGYALTTYAREEFGNEVWKDVLHEGAAYELPVIYSFSRALKRATGHTTKGLYRATMVDLMGEQHKFLQEERVPVNTHTGQPVVREYDRGIVDYAFLQAGDNGKLYAYARGNKFTPRLVEIDPARGTRRTLARIGIQREPYLDVRAGKATWMVDRVNARFTNEGYSDVLLFDLATGTKRRLTRKGKNLSPSLSWDGAEVVYVRHDELEGVITLQRINSQTGAVTQSVPIDALGVSYPKFTPDGKGVFFYHQDFDGVSIRLLDLATERVKILKPASHAPLGPPTVTAAGELLFSTVRGGIDNAALLDPQAGIIRQLTNDAVGVYFPVRSGGVQYHITPTAQGRRIFAQPAGTRVSDNIPADYWAGQPIRSNFFQRTNAFAAEMLDLTADVDSAAVYPTEDVSDGLFGIRLHSWTPVATGNGFGAGILFNNALNTISFAPQLIYNVNEEITEGRFDLFYGKWLPVLGLRLGAADRDFSVVSPFPDENGRLQGYVERANQVQIGASASVPLTFIHGQTVTRLTPIVTLDRFLLNDVTNPELGANFTSLGAGLTLSSLRQRGRQQIAPRLGAIATLRHDTGIGGSTDAAATKLTGRFYLPGIFRTHSLRIDGDYRREAMDNRYQYIDDFRYARGYDDDYSFGQSFRVGINYQLPLAYPEWNFAGIWYLKRLRFNGFYDIGGYRLDIDDGAFQDLRSVGGQLIFDNVWLNTVPAAFGIQLSRRLRDHIFDPAAAGTWNFRLVVTSDL